MIEATRPRILNAESSTKNCKHLSTVPARQPLYGRTLAFLLALLAVPGLLPPFVRCAPSHPDQGALIVHVSSGQLRGSLQGGTAVFLGIPYAAPPVGQLRWREPLPPNPWAGV